MDNLINVKLFNRQYCLKTDETKEYTEQLVKELNERMSEMLQSKLTMSVQDAAALIALECYEGLKKAKENEDRIRSEVHDYAEDASQAKAKAESAQQEVQNLQERVAQLENMLQNNKSEHKSNIPYNTFRNGGNSR
ncbi:MAG: cell division protein ZapA [Oscillospiraceae bacterium]